MESVKKANQLKCRVQNSELHARTSKCYDEERSIEEDTKANATDACRLSSLCEWSIKHNTWMNQQIGFSDQHSISRNHNEMASTVNSSRSGCSKDMQGHNRLGAKVDVVYSLLGMLGSTEGCNDMSATLLAMSNSIESCLVMRQSGCLPLLIQLIHTPGQNQEIRERASRALHNVILARSDEKIGRREVRVLRLLEQIRDYCQMLRSCLETERPPDDLERHPGPTIAALMKLSFDEAHRHAMCQLGGLHAVAELIEMDHAAHGSDSDDQSCITLRRYAGMALTNLTFGDGNNKALLCSFREFMKALVSQLRSLSDDLRQVTASVLRNLSWRADSSSKQILREVGAVTGLMKASMEGRKESTLKSILSALWNLSAHCSTNKVDICAVEGALAFLVDMLSYKAPSKTLSIVENAGGILRNVSSHIAVREDYRAIIRERGCLQVLLRQLRSPSLTVVSNACGALWNLSARCPYDQRLLWDLGAVPMLRSLVHSKHKMISMGSSAALKNLLSARPCGSNLVHFDSTARGLGLPSLPSLVARRQRALEQEIDQSLSETCDNIEPSSSPTNKDEKFSFKLEPNFIDVTFLTRTYHNNQPEASKNYNQVSRSESRESVRSITSTHSDTVFEKVHRHVSNGFALSDLQQKHQSSSLHSTINSNSPDTIELHNKTTQLEKKYTLCYKNPITERLGVSEAGIDHDNLKTITSTISWATAASHESTFSLLQSTIENKVSPTDSVKSTTSKTSDDYNFPKKLEASESCSQINYKNPTVTAPIIPANFNTSGNCIKPSISPVSNGRDPFGDYAETDLDEPTNYSLRYAERNSDDEKSTAEFFTGNEQDIEDTVKTYYTEGTPHGASLSSSRTASQSDLQYDSRIKLLPDKLLLSKTKNVDNQVQYLFQASVNKAEGSNTLLTEGNIISSCESFNKSHSDNDKKSHEVSNQNYSYNHTQEISRAEQSSNMTNIVTQNYNSKIDNESKIINDIQLKERELKATKKQNVITESESLTGSIASDGDDDDDDDLLAACIHIGMQNNRHIQSVRRNSLEKTLQCDSTLIRYQTTSALDQVETIEATNTNEKPLQSDKTNYNKISLSNTDVSKETSNIFTSSDENSRNIEQHKTIYVLEKKLNQSTPFYSMSSDHMQSCDSIKRPEQRSTELCTKIKTTINELVSCDETNFATNELASALITVNTLDDRSSILHEANSKENYKSSKHSKDEINTENLFKHQEQEEYRRQRDPDAMIASLDRLTATLVQQTEAMREKDSFIMKQSIQSDLWNEDSPNDLSFPSISISIPLVASSNSDFVQEDCTTLLQTFSEDAEIEQSSMTTSRIIELEAFKLAEVVSNEFNARGQASYGLDDIKPPSVMNSLVSLTTSFVVPENVINRSNQDECNSMSLPLTFLKPRISDLQNKKISLPVGVVAKRALAQDYNHLGSLESLLNDSNIVNVSQLENVKPPSIMDELLDNGDMENSIISVASIISEIADSKDQDSNNLIVNNSKMTTCNQLISGTKHAGNNANNSLSEFLDNINPPSLLNEINNIDDTTLDANTDTMCSDTLCIEYELNPNELHLLLVNKCEDMDENDTDEAATPIPTEYSCSSTESTPKRQVKKNNLTPKQKRQLAKERYKTYTIATELIKKDYHKEQSDLHTSSSGRVSQLSRLTPKQRRQENPTRFQTQVLDNPFSSPTSAIPTFQYADGSKKLKKNQLIDKKYQRKTSDNHISTNDTQVILEKNANIFHSLKKINKVDQTLPICEANLANTDSEIEINFQDNVTNGMSNTSVTKKLLTNSQEYYQKILPLKKNDSDVEDDLKEERDQKVNNLDLSESDNNENEFSPTDELPRKPRIVKPSNRDTRGDLDTGKSEPVSPKGIRGRRKALYSNPNTRKTTPQSSPIKQINISGIPIGRSNTSPIVRNTRAATLRQNTYNSDSNDQLKLGTSQKIPSTKNITLSKRSSIPQRKLTVITSKSIKRHSNPPESVLNGRKDQDEVPKPLERQSTFTKDEPEIENAPTVVIASPSKSKIAKPTRHLKISVKNTQTCQQTKQAQCVNAEKIVSSKLSTTVINKRYSGMELCKNPLENTNAHIPNIKKPINIEQRLHHNTSIAVQNSAEKADKKLAREAASKITSLWKKVEKNKNKQQSQKPDTRQWINAASNSTDTEKIINHLSSQRLFRSSTFEGVPKEADISKDSKPNEKMISTTVLRKQEINNLSGNDPTKRLSRLGSFITVDSIESQNTICTEQTTAIPSSAVVLPLNCTSNQETLSNITNENSEHIDSTCVVTT
ncbi:uncharacterized protein LOC103575404 isoform X2 [Microplitis demolitor]|uniref:uncharacterized protein LOC103575404 isoform X2 n=1 Tax=Microplitis demolitor TaxID=69319 RepID=UPI00235B653B|nr:uncharacterized protein LOC103575404 isoform X2 [Microplitis demolitor]